MNLLFLIIFGAFEAFVFIPLHGWWLLKKCNKCCMEGCAMWNCPRWQKHNYKANKIANFIINIGRSEK